MFDNARYMTIGIKNEISVELQLFMWNCIDALKEQGKEVDYLQVFELTKERVDDIFIQKIEHRQEMQQCMKVYNIFSAEMIDAKIFVIDDGNHSTMMFAEEY